eukprot:CAMPEP_0184493942 /NCGR_PEP_ID=MMETSP0113_2-20130426/27389_1 /TAXON_ID=91329 /ORGANISM="Norrisiella sphaerica, Strain BC52" /LENGTH=278 /DNA_ID=CAMNT_0026879441 /DNA_START=57 /DNA_END=893 /DNA_ORIENTATION=+
MANAGSEISHEQFILWWYGQFDKMGIELNVHKQRPPKLMRRFAAVAIDIMFYGLLPDLTSSFILNTWAGDFGSIIVAQTSVHAASVLLFHIRDSITSRSFGKYLMGLEIIQIERCHCPAGGDVFRTTEIPATRAMCLTRGIDAFLTHPFLTGANIALLLFSPARRSLGDHLSGTMVVPEGPHYHQRVDRMRKEFPTFSFRSTLVSRVTDPRLIYGLQAATGSEAQRKAHVVTGYPSLIIMLVGGLLYYFIEDHVDISVEIYGMNDDDDEDDDDGSEEI